MSAETEKGTCLRCGAPYEPGQTVCFKCGAPIGETRASTQPVPAVKVPRATEPSQPAATPAAGAPGLPVAMQTTSSPAAHAQREPRRESKRRRGGFIVLLVCVLVLAAGGGAAYAVRTLNAPASVSSITVYADPQQRFSFHRPTLWLVTPSPDGVLMTDSDGASTAKVTVTTPAANETAQIHAQSLAAQLGLSDATPQVPQQIAGQQWEQRSGQVTGSDGAVRQMVVYVTLHSGLLYTIQLSSPVASYSSTNNLVFQPLLASFSFS